MENEDLEQWCGELEERLVYLEKVALTSDTSFEKRLTDLETAIKIIEFHLVDMITFLQERGR